MSKFPKRKEMGLKFIVQCILGIGTVVLSSCTPAQNAAVSPFEQFTEWVTQDFRTPSSNSQTIILDRRARISSPDLPGFWTYTQLNTGVDTKLYRQRVNHFEPQKTGEIVQKSYALNDPEKFINAFEKPELLSSLSTEDLDMFLTPGCETIWVRHSDRSWQGTVDPATCRIFSDRRQHHIRIGADSRISADAYQTSERGFTDDMEFLWGSPVGELISLESLPPSE